MTPKEQCFMYLCNLIAALCYHPDVFPCKVISQGTHLGIRDVRKYMHELQDDGLVIYAHDGGFDTFNERPYCYHGYTLTAKGYDHPYYKEAYEEEVRWINRNNGDNDERC